VTDKRVAVELRAVTKAFGDVIAVDNVSFQVFDGEFLCLVGPSGCGKTTTLRLIAGFEYATAGEIFIHGEDMAAVPPHRRKVGMVFQSYALFPHLSVFENVAFGLRERRVDRQEIAEKVPQYLEMVRLGGYQDRKPGQLSGGQQQRVALARALVVQPSLLLMDEPLGSLDRKLRDEMQLEIKALLDELGITTITVTHDQDEALVMSDRVAVMKDGHVEQVGAPREIYEHPQSVFCATFLGVSNLFSGAVTRQTAEEAILTTAEGLELSCAQPGAAQGQVTLVIRPERVILNPPAPGANTFRGRVESVKYLGSEVEYYLLLGSGHKVVARRQISDAQDPLYRAGQEVNIQLPAHSLRPVR